MQISFGFSHLVSLFHNLLLVQLCNRCYIADVSRFSAVQTVRMGVERRGDAETEAPRYNQRGPLIRTL